MPTTNLAKTLGRGGDSCRRPGAVPPAGFLWVGGLLLLLLICGCAAEAVTMTPGKSPLPSAENGQALDFPTAGPADAAVTMTVFEDYQ